MKWTLVTIAFCLLAIITSQAQPPDSIIKANRHDFIAVGTNYKELGTGDYVAVATTTTEEDDKKLIKEYKKLKVPEPIYGYVSGKSLWYVCFNGETDIEKTRQKRDKIRNNKIFKDAWLITIHGSLNNDQVAMRHEFVARKSKNDLAAGDYVIIAVFTSEKNAKNMTEELSKLNFSQVGYGFLSNKDRWYV